MPTYDIERWDAVIPPGKIYPHPMIYIKPTKDFIQYAKDNKYIVKVTVSGTNMRYDDEPFVGIIDSSGYFPNERPNFYDSTGYFVITLFARWLGYPYNNGKILIQGSEGPDQVQMPEEVPFHAPAPIEYFQSKEVDPDGLSNKQLCWVGIFLVIFAILLTIFSHKINA